VVALVSACTFQFHNHTVLEVGVMVVAGVHMLHSEYVADDGNMGRRQLAVRERTSER